MKTSIFTKILGCILAVAICFAFASCGKQSAIDIVRNGEFNDYPGVTLENKILDIAESNDQISVSGMKWQDVSDDFSSVLDKNQSMVKFEFTMDAPGDAGKHILLFLVDNENKSFNAYSVSVNGNVIDTPEDINTFYRRIFNTSY